MAEPKENPSIEFATKKAPGAVASDVVAKDEPEPTPSTSVNGRRESLESDEEELKKQYHRSGRRPAITENEVRSPLLNRKQKEEVGESSRTERWVCGLRILIKTTVKPR